MTRFRAAKRLDALDAEITALEKERAALEIRALGAEATADERRSRYFSIGDPGLRRKAIGIERSLHDLRQKERTAAIEYWATVAAETRAKLDDLKNDSPNSAWRRRIWWDVLTLLWILAGGGWLVLGIPGAAAGTAATALAAWFILRSRKQARFATIRQGEDVLHSSESELRKAEQDQALPAKGLFSASEEQTGLPDGG
jgi:hypothetical protein